MHCFGFVHRGDASDRNMMIGDSRNLLLVAPVVGTGSKIHQMGQQARPTHRHGEPQHFPSHWQLLWLRLGYPAFDRTPEGHRKKCSVIVLVVSCTYTYIECCFITFTNGWALKAFSENPRKVSSFSSVALLSATGITCRLRT